MEYNLSELRKSEYDKAMKSAQELELNIGSAQYRISRLVDARKDIDIQLKKWWDEVLKEMCLDTNRDYMISMDGIVKDVTQEAPKTTASPAIPLTVDELK